MRWLGLLPAAVLVVIALACEENPAEVSVVVTEAPCDTVFVIKRVPCVWRRHFGWVCLDAPLPDEPIDDNNEEGSDA